MPAACKCNAILSEEKEETLKEIIKDIQTSKLPVKVFTYYYTKEQKQDKVSLYDLIEKKFFAYIMHIRRGRYKYKLFFSK